MDLNETRKAIELYLNLAEKHDYMNNHIENQIKECYEFINKQIDLLTKDEEPEEVDFKVVHIALDSLKKITLYNPLTPNYIAFVTQYIELVRNWNSNFKNDDVIKENLVMMMRLIKQHFSIMEASEILKGLCMRLRDFKSWLPPAFDVSGHYIDLLNEDGVKSPSNGDDKK